MASTGSRATDLEVLDATEQRPHPLHQAGPEARGLPGRLQDGRGVLVGAFDDYSSDDKTLDRLHEARGFCAEHAERLRRLEVEGLYSDLGISNVYLGTLQGLEEALDSLDPSENQVSRPAAVKPRPSTLTPSNSDVYVALRQPGCPLCRTHAGSERRNVATFLREGKAVPASRTHFIEAGGFCPRHAWQLHAAASEVLTGAGIADLYGQLADRDLALLEQLSASEPGKAGRRKLESGLHRSAPCPMCLSMETIRRHHAAFLAELLDDEVGRATYERSDGVCFQHLREAVEASLRRDRDGNQARWLVEDWRQRLAQLRTELREYDRKRSYTAASERKGDEQRSWTTVIERYAGTM